MAKKLPTRPNLDHLRRQAKTLLGQLKAGDEAAARAFIQHLPEARRMSVAAVRAAGFRLADAQSVVARQTGLASWPALSRHVQQLRALEGEWRFAHLEIEGMSVPTAALAASRVLIDGDRFRTESPEANYEGVFTIDVEAKPAHIDIEFIEGPEAGNWCYGVFALDGDDLTLCLGLAGASRPGGFETQKASGHALERLRRASTARPENVTGGTPGIAQVGELPREDPAGFDQGMTPELRRLEGEWVPVALVRDGKPLPPHYLAFGSRQAVGNEVKVVFVGQVMVHARVRVDATVSPTAVDYLNLDGAHAGSVSRGIMAWVGEEVQFLMAPPGQPRPTEFAAAPATGTLSRWRRRA